MKRSTSKESVVEQFVTKDGGDRAKFDGGMVRDTEVGKVRWDLIPDDVFFSCLENTKNLPAIQAYRFFKETGFRHQDLIREVIMIECHDHHINFWKRVADLMARGAEKYGEHNWMKGKGEEVYARYKKSLDRHFKQWLLGDREEDHAAAIAFNVNGILYIKPNLESQ